MDATGDVTQGTPIAFAQCVVTVFATGQVTRGTSTAAATCVTTFIATGSVVAGGTINYNFELNAKGRPVEWQAIGCVILSESGDTERILVGSGGTGQVIGTVDGQVVETTTFSVSKGTQFAHSVVIRNI